MISKHNPTTQHNPTTATVGEARKEGEVILTFEREENAGSGERVAV